MKRWRRRDERFFLCCVWKNMCMRSKRFHDEEILLWKVKGPRTNGKFLLAGEHIYFMFESVEWALDPKFELALMRLWERKKWILSHLNWIILQQFFGKGELSCWSENRYLVQERMSHWLSIKANLDSLKSINNCQNCKVCCVEFNREIKAQKMFFGKVEKQLRICIWSFKKDSQRNFFRISTGFLPHIRHVRVSRERRWADKSAERQEKCQTWHSRWLRISIRLQWLGIKSQIQRTIDTSAWQIQHLLAIAIRFGTYHCRR